MIDKSCTHYGPHHVQSVEHRFFSCTLAQLDWCYAANIIWQLFAKRGNLGPHKSFSIMQCLLILTSLSISHWTLLGKDGFSWGGLPWIVWRQWNDLILNNKAWPIEKMHHVVWDALLDFGRLEWQHTLKDPKKKPWMLPIKTFLMNFIQFGVLKDLLLLIVI